MSRIPPAVVAAVLERADGFCEGCGGPGRGKMDMHHRLLRSAGGRDTVETLMFMHHECHMNAHQNPARSYRLYHMLRRGSDPATSPPPVAVRDLRTLRA